MGEETVRKVLKDFGLTEKETNTYIFLAKHGPLKGGEIAKRTKTQKAQVYRMLKSLQSKGLVEATLEAPTRFTAVQFENFIDMSIKAKKEEAVLLEKTKNELLSYWRSISQSGPEPPLEKFVVIEGNHRIYPKISQMIKETKKQFSAIVTVSGLVRADQYGLFDTMLDHPLRSKIQFRFLTELDEQGLNAIKTLLMKVPKTKLKIKARNPDIGLQFSPRMAIRDNEEILFFITPRTSISAAGQDDTCLWTNCAELVQAFKAIFEEGWRNSSDTEKKILEIETSKSAQGPLVTHDPGAARKNYETILDSAKEEILMLTSSKELTAYSRKKAWLKKWVERGVSVKIMAPITSNNLKAAEELSKFYEVRHVPPSYLKTTIVDGKHLFQFKMQNYGRTLIRTRSPDDQEKSFEEPDYEDIAYSNNSVYVGKMKALLHDIWKNSVAPSKVTLDSVLDSVPTVMHFPDPSARSPVEIPQTGPITFPTYCSAQAVIHTPAHLNMPDLLIDLTHFGEPTDEKGNWMSISLWLKTSEGYTFVPTAVVMSRGRRDRIASRLENVNRAVFAAAPAGQNVLLVKEHEFQMLKQGNTLFVGWTVPIPLLPPKLFLPPAFLLFEGYGNSTHFKNCVTTPSGLRITIENDGSEAFVTFISPSSRYTGPGTDGRLCTNGLNSMTKVTK